MDDFKVRLAEVEDFPLVERLCYQFFSETMYKVLDYSKENTLEMIRDWQYILLIETGDGVPAGFCSLNVCHTYYVQKEGDVDKFYIVPEFRGTVASRMLAGSVVKLAKALDAKIVYALCGSGISEKTDRLFHNLWAKFGFKKLGVLMMGQ